METTVFLIKAVIVSLTGVLSPGAMTAATIAHGTRRRWAGTFIAFGHGIIELPLIGLLLVGLHLVFEMPPFQIAIGLFGGAFILWMGFGMLRQKPDTAGETSVSGRPLLVGILLSAGNPYFLLWWATLGLNLALEARHLGLLAIVLFALIHWLCDLFWLTFLSMAAFYTHRGAGLMGARLQRWILIVCGIALLLFGAKFICDAVSKLAS